MYTLLSRMVEKYRKRDLAMGLTHVGSGQTLSVAAAEDIIKNLCQQLALALCCGKSVYLPGIGKFTPVLRKGRYARHPKTSNKILFPPKVAVRFTSSTLLRKQLQSALLEKLIAESDASTSDPNIE